MTLTANPVILEDDPANPPRPAQKPVARTRPWLAQLVPIPTLRLAAVAAAAGAPAALWPSGWPIVVAIVVVAVGVDLSRCQAPWQIPLARDLRAAVPLATSTLMRWRIVNPSGRALRVSVADELAPSLGAEARRASIEVPAGAVASVSIRLRPSRRGRFRPTAVTVRASAPWGLVARQHTRYLPAVIEVHPTFHSRREAELRITRGRILEVGLRSARGLGHGTDFESMRAYTVDDEFRRIDWPATARAGRPIVRTYRAERNQSVVVLLDTGRLMAGVVGGVPRLDHAMDAVMALTTVATRLGDRAGLIAFSSMIRATVPPRHDRGQLARMTEAMFTLEPDLTESAYDHVFSRTVAVHKRRSLLVLLTELATEALPETLVPALPILLRRHLVLIGTVMDPEVENWRLAEPRYADDVYRAAGAVTVRRGRDRTADLLRRLGVTVVDAPPGQLAGRLADAYLDVKATGRL